MCDREQDRSFRHDGHASPDTLGDMVADADAGQGDECFVVPSGLPHLAPVLELPGVTKALARYLPLFVRCRDEHDEASREEVWQWLWANYESAEQFLSGLVCWAEITVRYVVGPGAEQQISAIAEQRSTWTGLAECRPLVVEGYLAAAPLARHTFRGDTEELVRLVDHLISSGELVWGAAVGLADIIIDIARSKWGRAREWIETLRYLSTGQGQPRVNLRQPDPAAELATMLGEPHPAEPEQTRPRPPATLSDTLAGGQLAPSFLCYREADATHSEHDIQEWIRAHPASTVGFLATLAAIAHDLLRAGYGRQGHEAINYIIEITAEGDACPTAAGITLNPTTDRAEDFAEGYRSAAPLLRHMARNDHHAADTLLHTLREPLALTIGTATALADITLGAAEDLFDSPTEFVHFLHSTTTALTINSTSTDPHPIAAAG